MIRQALEQDLVDDLSILIAPVVLGGGKRLLEGFTKDVELEHLGAAAAAAHSAAPTPKNDR